MLAWININKSEEEVKGDGLQVFIKASERIGLSIFADTDFPELICICDGQDAQTMAEKASRGIVQSLQINTVELAVAI